MVTSSLTATEPDPQRPKPRRGSIATARRASADQGKKPATQGNDQPDTTEPCQALVTSGMASAAHAHPPDVDAFHVVTAENNCQRDPSAQNHTVARASLNLTSQAQHPCADWCRGLAVRRNGQPDSGGYVGSTLSSYPRLGELSDEMIVLRFHNNTSEVMSIRAMENPWRKWILPRVQGNQALFHAIASMSCFHASKSTPRLARLGTLHMGQSIAMLRRTFNSVPHEEALMTCLALAFSTSWDNQQSVRTGVDHIKGAKQFILKALADDNRIRDGSDEYRQRLIFLCKTWIYVDVLARLTSVDEDVSNDFDFFASKMDSPFFGRIQLDPLMGCACNLFPTIGRVANLVRKAYKVEQSTPALISEAATLKTCLDVWEPPAVANEDCSNSDILDCINTAWAYRDATLLSLHQAVPEILHDISPAEYGRRILNYLAAIPPTSGTIIIHIYPLLAGGCEVVSPQDRQWVLNRWDAMSQRMAIGNIDCCRDVVQKVWSRRDDAAMDAAVFEDMTHDYLGVSFGNPTPDSLSQLRSPNELALTDSVWTNTDAMMNPAWVNDAITDPFSTGNAMGDSTCTNGATSNPAWTSHATMDPPWTDCDMLDPAWVNDAITDSAQMNHTMTNHASTSEAMLDPAWINNAFTNTAWMDDANNMLTSTVTIAGSPSHDLRVGGDYVPCRLPKLDHEFTVRGRMHWVGVMKDFGWEGKERRSGLKISRLTKGLCSAARMTGLTTTWNGVGHGQIAWIGVDCWP